MTVYDVPYGPEFLDFKVFYSRKKMLYKHEKLHVGVYYIIIITYYV